MKKLTLLSIALSLFALVARVALAAEHTKDSLEAVQENLKKEKAVLIDVREPDEWKKGHLAQAKLLPMSELRKNRDKLDPKLAEQLPKDRVIYLHCAAGGRCLLAADVLAKHGYEVRALKSGYEELVEAKFPVAQPDGRKSEDVEN